MSGPLSIFVKYGSVQAKVTVAEGTDGDDFTDAVAAKLRERGHRIGEPFALVVGSDAVSHKDFPRHDQASRPVPFFVEGEGVLGGKHVLNARALLDSRLAKFLKDERQDIVVVLLSALGEAEDRQRKRARTANRFLDFAEALMQAKFAVPDETAESGWRTAGEWTEHSVIDLSAAVGILGLGTLSHVWVRSSYVALRDRVLRALYSDSPHEATPVVLTGTPGVGKSAFFLLIVREALLRLRDDVKHASFAFRMAGFERTMLYEWSQDGLTVSRMAAPQSVLHLFDAVKPPATVRFLLSSSPNDSVMHQAVKQAMTYYMPTWTLDELLECNKVCQKRDTQVVASLFALWGGSARPVLGMLEQASETQWETLLASTTYNSFYAMAEAIGNPGKGKNESIRDSIVHLKVQMEGDHAYLKAVRTWGSTAMLDQLLKSMDGAQRIHQVRTLMNMCSADSVELRGILFERFAHCKERFTNMATLKAAGKLAPGKYYYSKVHTFEAVDSFALSEDSRTLVLYQMTVSREHSEKFAGILEVYSLRPESCFYIDYILRNCKGAINFPLLQQYRQATTPAARQDYDDAVVQASIIAISTLTRNRVIPTTEEAVQARTDCLEVMYFTMPFWDPTENTQDQIIKGLEAARAKLKEKITTYKKEQVRFGSMLVLGSAETGFVHLT
eukprot:m51a1_g3804 hypothetical protein (672) ;mRNA; f:218487-232237